MPDAALWSVSARHSASCRVKERELSMRVYSALCALILGLGMNRCIAQSAGGRDSTQDLKRASEAEVAGDQLTMFLHSESTPWYIAGQSNIIFQAHPPFHSPYEGTNSFLSRGEYKTSLLGTFYLGDQPWRGFFGRETRRELRYNTDLILNLESAGGRGLSEALGLAGFTNLDVVRNPNLGSVPYMARGEVHQTIGFTNEMVDNVRGPLSLATRLPARRLEIRAGKMSLPDVFDLNSVLSDSHLQFTNWTIDNNGAWDYAADTRGYTYALTVEYQDRDWGLRYGLALMPTVANGIDLDWDLKRARGQNVEAEWRKSLLHRRKGVQRVLAYANNAHMGNYREAVNAYLAGEDSTPQITKHEHFDAVKYGFGYNFEQGITDHWRVAGRFGWNDGKTESFAYTEVEQNVLVGSDYDGAQWGRRNDKIGVAFTSNAIKRDHQHYLADGGLGFILGDGHLLYGRENTVESYYNLHAWKGLYFALGLSHINNPGYNRDRGPIWVPSVRAHIDF
jgi:high affinity Mn2+ porin